MGLEGDDAATTCKCRRDGDGKVILAVACVSPARMVKSLTVIGSGRRNGPLVTTFLGM